MLNNEQDSYRTVVVWLSKIINFASTSLHFATRLALPRSSRYVLILSELKPKPILTHSYSFPRALRQLRFWLSVLSAAFWMAWVVTLVLIVLRSSIENCSDEKVLTLHHTHWQQPKQIEWHKILRTKYFPLHPFFFGTRNSYQKPGKPFWLQVIITIKFFLMQISCELSNALYGISLVTNKKKKKKQKTTNKIRLNLLTRNCHLSFLILFLRASVTICPFILPR